MSGLLTSALGVGAFLLHGGHNIRFSSLLVGSLWLHDGLTSALLPTVIAALVSTVVSVLTVTAAAMSVPRPRVAARIVAMFLDLSLRQQASGLPSARTSLVLLVLPIELQ